jgi:hypothetical protein
MTRAVMRQNEVANHFGVSGITKIIIMSHLRATDCTSVGSGNREPRETTQRQDRHIQLVKMCNQFIALTIIANQTVKKTKQQNFLKKTV